MNDDVALPVHTGYQPSQPDPTAWVSLTPAGEVEEVEDDTTSRATSSRPTEPGALGWEMPGVVTPETVARVAQTGSFADLLDHLDLPDGATDALTIMKLTDLPTLEAALCSVSEILDAMCRNGVSDTMRPFLRSRLITLQRALTPSETTPSPPSPPSGAGDPVPRRAGSAH